MTSEQVVKCAGCGRTLPNDAIGKLCFKCIRKSGAGVQNERPFINPTEEARQIVCDLAYMLPDTEAVRKQVRDYVEDRFRVAVERLEAERQSDTARLRSHLGAIAAECLKDTVDRNEVYHQCYIALVGDLMLPANEQAEIMRAAIESTKERLCFEIEGELAARESFANRATRLEILESLIEECGDKEITIARRRDGKIWITAERHFAALGACSSGETLSAAIDAAQSTKEPANG